MNDEMLALRSGGQWFSLLGEQKKERGEEGRMAKERHKICEKRKPEESKIFFFTSPISGKTKPRIYEPAISTSKTKNSIN